MLSPVRSTTSSDGVMNGAHYPIESAMSVYIKNLPHGYKCERAIVHMDSFKDTPTGRLHMSQALSLTRK